MKKTVLLIIGMIVLLCACSCSEEAVIKKITDAIEFEFECEFDVWCDHADDFQEFERALSTIGAEIKEKTQSGENVQHYLVKAPSMVKESISLLSSFEQTILICGENYLISPSDISKCWLKDDFFAVVEADAETCSKMGAFGGIAYLKSGETKYDAFVNYEEGDHSLSVYAINREEDKAILTAWVYSINEICFEGSVQISDIKEQKTKQSVHLFS